MYRVTVYNKFKGTVILAPYKKMTRWLPIEPKVSPGGSEDYQFPDRVPLALHPSDDFTGGDRVCCVEKDTGKTPAPRKTITIDGSVLQVWEFYSDGTLSYQSDDISDNGDTTVTVIVGDTQPC